MKTTNYAPLILASLIVAGTALAGGPILDKTTDAFPVVKLMTRSGTVTIKVTEAGPVYTVQNKDGKTVAVNLTEMQLKAQNRELYNLIKPAVATSSAFPFTLDASLAGE